LPGPEYDAWRDRLQRPGAIEVPRHEVGQAFTPITQIRDHHLKRRDGHEIRREGNGTTPLDQQSGDYGSDEIDNAATNDKTDIKEAMSDDGMGNHSNHDD
jgi:hypothetical protein